MAPTTITTLEELNEVAAAERADAATYDHDVIVCVSSGCESQGATDIRKALVHQAKEQGKAKTCRVRGVGCLGLCANGPHVVITDEDKHYHHVKPDDAPEIIASIGDKPIERLAYSASTPFFTRQKLIVRENAGKIDPERIEDYFAMGGYTALYKALSEMTPAEVIEEITRSGLRGRGGGGYPTGLKWRTVAKATGNQKYIICNADEGDPGAFMDRSVLESDPHRVLEAMAIAGYAVGANKGYIYVRAEYGLAINRLETAIKQAKRRGLLGFGIFSSNFDFDIEIRLGAGAFVCGEETALMASIEGRRGNPRPRPPYPAEFGLWGAPTLINNVETFANIVPIIREGADWFASIGTAGSKGTKIFALTGQLVNSGLIEVPMGITLREIVYDIGGGPVNGRTIKAVQTGGPSGGCIAESQFDLPVDYESLKSIGSMMGSGGMIVMDDTSSMVEVAQYFMEFSMIESCGKCIPCRVGTAQIYNLLGRIRRGEGTLADIELIEQLGDLMRNTSLCGLGMAAPNPVFSTLNFFRHEYIELLKPAPANGHTTGKGA